MIVNIEVNKVKQLGDYVRYLSTMGIQRANSGHPGLPLGCADIGISLYGNLMKATSAKPDWMNRDRFILSAGHGSMLVYSLNYIFGYDFSVSDLANFRQLHSKTAGHPEYELELGIETTTGPLGQGFANAVGTAIESKMMAARFNKPDYNLFDYKTYVLMGDGCTMEGMTNEAASIAGSLGLDNLIAIYDDNSVTIDESSMDLFREDVKGRYQALGWEVLEAPLGTDIEDVNNKLATLRDSKSGKPKLLIVKTKIGQGLNSLLGSHKAHGAPVGAKEIAYLVENSDLKSVAGTSDQVEAQELLEKQLLTGDFFNISNFKDALGDVLEKRESYYTSWETMFNDYKTKFPKEYAELLEYRSTGLTQELRSELLNYSAKADATRNTSADVLQIVAKHTQKIIGGCADLVASTKATVKGADYITRDDFSGRNIAFGIREAAMGGIGNGLALSRDFIPFTSTFFTFIDYMKPAVRLASIMKLNHLFVFTHDSIYVGEDGPTHEPIEHLGATRLIPGLYTYRPANDMEMAFSYLEFMENEGPAVILGTRQVLNQKLFGLELDRAKAYEGFKKGGYVLLDTQTTPDITLVGSGSEVSTLLESKEMLESKGKSVRLVSIPCLEKFEEQGSEYVNNILGNGPIYLMEAASHRGNKAFYRDNILVRDITTFGMSGSYKDVSKHFGFVAEAATKEILEFISK
ncbi:transketolase [Thiospirochaeta perfilievii]|uniref:transketolase n=1 Tax=Thiospirochaeta perfilievii TaxID=252967 RepID=A0A5C1QBY2_9SPIO|nr:transketolase [Thiospirochaeta perfilievii]